jgi:hypothetical protein
MKRAMRRRIIAYLTVILLIFGACEKDDERIDNFLVEFATVIQTADRLTFQLDNFKTLVPIDPRGYSGKDGQRVILNYSPLRGDTIQINSVNDIFTGIIRESDDLSTLIKDPVKIQSVWVGGNHLNMILEIEYFEKRHVVGLFRDTRSKDIDLHFSHSREGDPPGYTEKFYASFPLANIKSSDGSPTPFRLHIHTHSGGRIFEMEVR